MIDELRKYELMLLREQAKRLARQDFATYLQFTNANYSMQWFHRLIAEHCQMLFEGKIKNLMIFVPPQHGKSEVISRNFPAWAMGKNPNLKIAGCSYSADLAMQFSGHIQRSMYSPEYAELFGDFYSQKMKGVKRNAEFFEVPQHSGFYKAVGVGGSLTGTPVDIGIIDDPVKDAEQAYSATYREKVWDWYTSVFLTRLHNESKQIFIMTRWHEDDLAGRILEKEPDKWTILSFPAIKEDDCNPLDPREIGEALWPERHSLERLLEQKARSPRVFTALYQQRPAILGGNIVKRDWFKRISFQEFSAMRSPLQNPMVFFVDTAYTEKKSNDPTGIIATAKIGDHIYIADAQKWNLNFPDLCRRIPEYCQAMGYGRGSSIRIEPKANGISVIDQLRENTRLAIVPTPTPSDSKETRFNCCAPSIEAGKFVLVDGPWVEDYLNEVCNFPASPHDEFVDVTAYAHDFYLAGQTAFDIGRLAKALNR